MNLPNLKPPAPSLELLRKFMSELETSFSTANLTKQALSSDDKVNVEYLVEMAKGLGFLTAIIQEATLLAGDIKREMTYASSPGGQKSLDQLENLMKGLPGEDDFATVLPFNKPPRGPNKGN